MPRYLLRILLTILAVWTLHFIVRASDIEKYEIKLVKHKFAPDIITASADKIIKLKIINTDSTVEEFESFELKREKIVTGNSSITITVGPLKPGEYKFFGEFHPQTAQGKLIIK